MSSQVSVGEEVAVTGWFLCDVRIEVIPELDCELEVKGGDEGLGGHVG